MKKRLKKWILRLAVTGLFISGLLFVIILNPTLLYANKTTFGNYTVYHNLPLDRNFQTQLDKASGLLLTSELYDPTFKLDICLNDGSFYSTLIQSLHEPAFGIGFYNKVVIMGNINCKDNYVEIRGYRWNMAQLLAHEELHCLQFNKFGLWKSNPVANYPQWKWEGYNEYIARQNADQKSLSKNIKRLNEAEKTDKTAWGISFGDGTVTSRKYYGYWILVQYCKLVKKMGYKQILQDTTKEEHVKQEMMNWYTMSLQ